MISFAALLVFFLFIVAKPAFGITIGVPDELLTGLPLAELHTFGKGVLTLFAGYTGVEPNIVEEPLDQLMQQLIQGDIDAVLSRPRTGITESDAYLKVPHWLQSLQPYLLTAALFACQQLQKT